MVEILESAVQYAFIDYEDALLKTIPKYMSGEVYGSHARKSDINFFEAIIKMPHVPFYLMGRDNRDSLLKDIDHTLSVINDRLGHKQRGMYISKKTSNLVP